ncbi:hypothetical protein AZI86_11690 [Bdellovibrio bacteriovorus]|uniref:Peptidase C1A papain C-terminal domain-containing protein n=1 Tax=Bdellovibrio bacteriovorus TaxID=959 RepID=A0A150WLQ1_BDEBC|nr:hypothetical protein [Bdellovibrio bacteriovorus]KYG64858.1 hypothetical protein AZI86_11690 [Bdellovibrio bacteriovorus]
MAGEGKGLATLAYQANGRGACLESQLKSEGSLVDNGVNYYLGERTLALMGQNTKTVKLGGKRDRDKYERKWMPLPKAPSEEAYMQLCAPKGYDMFNGAAAWVDQLNNESLKELRKNIDGLCSPRVPMKPMEIEQWSLTSVPRMHEISNKLASFLKAGNPVSIGYSTTFLEKGRAAQPSFDNLHESSIVGMRWNDNTQTCEFKLRNSWGKSCALYAPEFQRVCEDGYLWINDRDVRSNVNALTVIKLKK